MPEEQHYISKIKLPSGTTYDIRDAKARSDIATLQTLATGAMYYIGSSATPITDNGTEKPTISNEQKTLGENDAGAVCIYLDKEYVWNGTNWQEFGSTGSLKALAFKENASGNFTPSGTVSQPTFTGSESTVTITATDNSSGNYQPTGTVSQPTFSNGEVTASGKFTPAGTINVSTSTKTNQTATVAPAANGETTYKPAGSVDAPTITCTTPGSTKTINFIDKVGSLPSWNGTVDNEVLTISWSAGELPTKGENTTVKTGDAVYSASAPAFNGTAVRLVTGNIEVPATYKASFTGTEGDINVIGKATGDVSTPTFTGNKVQLAGTTTAAGTVSQPSFTGTEGTVTVS